MPRHIETSTHGQHVRATSLSLMMVEHRPKFVATNNVNKHTKACNTAPHTAW